MRAFCRTPSFKQPHRERVRRLFIFATGLARVFLRLALTKRLVNDCRVPRAAIAPNTSERVLQRDRCVTTYRQNLSRCFRPDVVQVNWAVIDRARLPMEREVKSPQHLGTTPRRNCDQWNICWGMPPRNTEPEVEILDVDEPREFPVSINIRTFHGAS